MRLEAAIAWRYLRSRKGPRLLSLISVIAMGGVVVGVSALILVLGVMTGLQQDLRDKILIGSPDLRVLTLGEDLVMSDWEKTLAMVRRQPDVLAAQPFVLKDALITKGNDYAEPVKAFGVLPLRAGEPDVTDIRRHVRAGSFTFASPDTNPAIVLGQKLAERLNVWPGEQVVLATAPGRLALSGALGGFVPVVRRYTVTGVFETGMYEYDSGYAYMSLANAQELAGLGPSVTGIDVRVPDRWRANEVAERLATTLGFPYRTLDWQEQNRSLFQALKLEKLAMAVILLLIVLVGFTGSLVLVVPAVGTGLGVALGTGAAWALRRFELVKLDPTVYFIDHLPVEIAPLDVALIAASSLAVTMLATLWPARQAARLTPVEAIRHE